MTHPTKAIAPILLEDMRKVAVERKGESNFFTSQMIKDCMKKVIAVTLHQSVMVDPELEIKAYYAGHVLGAAMFWIRVGSQSIVYTGDYNMTPDRHLGAAYRRRRGAGAGGGQHMQPRLEIRKGVGKEIFSRKYVVFIFLFTSNSVNFSRMVFKRYAHFRYTNALIEAGRC